MDAITRCPSCRTSFRVTELQLRAADGNVRCGACLLVFRAEEFLLSPFLGSVERQAISADYWSGFEQYIEQVARPPAPAAFEKPSDAGDDSLLAEVTTDEDLMLDYLDYLGANPGRVPILPELPVEEALQGAVEDSLQGAVEDSLQDSVEDSLQGVVEDSLQVSVEDSTVSPQAVSGELHDLEPPRFLAEELPDLAFDEAHLLEDRRRVFQAASLRWLPGILLLVFVAMGQYAFFNMDRYAQQESYRPWFLTVCRVAGCSVPDYENHDLLQTRELVIRSHTVEADALVVDVLLRNSAGFRQQFPGLKLTFLDISGETVASRIFYSPEYLGGEMRGLRYIPAVTEVRLSLEIVDPGPDALGYSMEVVRI